MTTGLFALMLLADGRLPAGGHVHSGGIESAVADGRVHDLASLRSFTEGRLWTAGLTDAALSAATVERLMGTGEPTRQRRMILAVDDEADARLPSHPLRSASRRLGRQLTRVALRCWPSTVLLTLSDALPDGGHASVVLGTVAVAADLPASMAVELSLHHCIATPTQAAVRLLGLDPYGVAALSAELAGTAREVAGLALGAAAGPLEDLPAPAGPIVEIAAVDHADRDLRLFAT